MKLMYELFWTTPEGRSGYGLGGPLAGRRLHRTARRLLNDIACTSPDLTPARVRDVTAVQIIIQVGEGDFGQSPEYARMQQAAYDALAEDGIVWPDQPRSA